MMYEIRAIWYVYILFLLSQTLSAQTAGTQLLKNGLKFLDVPYVANTLDINDQECLVINCDEVDCTTFVEYALAMTLSQINSGKINKNDFPANVQKIRYRNGKINGYTSRLHYISDWIDNGVRNGFLTDVSYKQSIYYNQTEFSYMSSHSEQYKQLANSLENITLMKKIEKELSEKEIRYIPKDQLPINGLPWIQNGDIIAITTNIPGLDICHMGIAFYVQGKLCLLHASSSAKKVLVSRIALAQMLKMTNSWTGIRVVRIKD